MADRPDQARKKQPGLQSLLKMIRSEVIIVGGGPAGSTCARQLKMAGVSTLILEKKEFPRPKVCAGWVTPGVFRSLGTLPQNYPYPLTRLRKINFHLLGIRAPVNTRQYAVRRIEFDRWLLEQAGVPVYVHKARSIKKNGRLFVIDEKFECRILIGAGGSHCPAARAFFRKKKKPPDSALVCAVESEFKIENPREDCHIWYLSRRLPGYAWYLPKNGGWVNLGIGGKFQKLKKQGVTIMDHWRWFVGALKRKSFITQDPGSPKGHVYYLRHQKQGPYRDNVYLIGDAAGLSTLDMGEGIHAAVKSGLAAAEAVIHSGPYHIGGISRFSLPGVIWPDKS